MMRNQRAILRTCVASCALLWGMVPYALAQDANGGDADDLSEVVVEGASVLDRQTLLTTRKISDDIARVQLEDVRDIGRLDPTIGYNTRNGSFVVRGLDSHRVLTTIDGIRIPWLNDPARGGAGGVSTFDFNALSMVDVVRGSDSSLAGSGVLGGIVALRTLEPEDLLTDEKNWAGLTRSSYDSTDKSWRIDQAFALRAEQTTMLFQGGYAKGKERETRGDVGGFGAGRSRANPSEFDQNNVMAKIYHLVDHTHRFGLAVERYDYDQDGFDYTASAAYRQGSMRTDEQARRERVSVSYDYRGDGWVDEAHARLYWQRQRLVEGTDADRLTKPIGDYRRSSMMEEESYGLFASGAKMLETGDFSHSLRFFTDVRLSQYKQFAGGQDNCPPPPYFNPFDACWFLHVNQSDAPNTDSVGFGFAIEDEMAFFDNQFRVTPGVRFDYFRHEPKRSSDYEKNIGFAGVYPDDVSDSRFSPKLRFEWDVADRVTLYAGWAQGFRAPTVPELYQFYINPGRYFVRGNPDLKPETSNGFDIGAHLGDDQLGGSLAIFHNRYKNFIDALDLGANSEFRLFRQQYVNRAKVRITGVEAKGHWVFADNWRSQFGLAYAEGKDSGTGEYLNSVPALKAVLGLGYSSDNWGADAVVTAVAKRDKVENAANFAKTSGYNLVDVTGWWSPFGEKGPRLQAGVYNLFDKKYWDAVSMPATSNQARDYFSEPGRNFKISLTQKF